MLKSSASSQQRKLTLGSQEQKSKQSASVHVCRADYSVRQGFRVRHTEFSVRRSLPCRFRPLTPPKAAATPHDSLWIPVTPAGVTPCVHHESIQAHVCLNAFTLIHADNRTAYLHVLDTVRLCMLKLARLPATTDAIDSAFSLEIPGGNLDGWLKASRPFRQPRSLRFARPRNTPAFRGPSPTRVQPTLTWTHAIYLVIS